MQIHPTEPVRHSVVRQGRNTMGCVRSRLKWKLWKSGVINTAFSLFNTCMWVSVGSMLLSVGKSG